MNDRTDVEFRQLVREEVADAVADGLRQVITDPEVLDQFWHAAVQQLQKNAQQQTGRWVLAGAKSLVTRWLVIGVIVLAAMKLGGAELAGKVWKALVL